MSRRSALTAPPPAELAGCVFRFNGQQVRVPFSAHTLAGFRAWARSDQFPQQGQVSFLGQEVVVDMSPEKVESHNKVKTEVTRVLANLNVKLDLGDLYGDRTLLTNAEVGLSTEPDGAFATWATLESGRLRPVKKKDEDEDYLEIEGAPDWVLEIVSASSVRKDTQTLRELYHRAGVPEYWLIDARGEEIAFELLRHEPAGYVARVTRGGWQKSAVFGRSFRLERSRGRLGAWHYTLRMKVTR
jgi:Uma2 family endonuclease